MKKLFNLAIIFLVLTTLDAIPLDSPETSGQEPPTTIEKPDSEPEKCKDVEIKEKSNLEDDNEEVEETNDVQEKSPIKGKTKKPEESEQNNSQAEKEPIPCTCGVFLSGQFKKGSKKQPKGLPVLTQEMDTPFMNNVMGNRQCTNKCLELIIKHLPKSNEIICATVDRDHVFKERAYLFVKNHSDKWHGTNLSAGREYCCRDNVPYKCPV